MPGRAAKAAEDTIGAVLLGAGFSRRFGADKRVAQLFDQTVAETTCAIYTGVFEQVRVVVRADDDVLIDRLSHLNVNMVVAPDAHLGMGHSLAAGISGLPWKWAFVGLLDMPFIEPRTLQHLLNQARRMTHPGIVRPRLREPADDGAVFGHPIGWHRNYFAEIELCQGDTGARELLQKYPADIVEVIVDDSGILRDIDTPADLP